MANHPLMDFLFKCNDVERMPDRFRLGFSQIGSPCYAQLWFSYRLASMECFDGATQFRFEDGHYSEKITAERLARLDHVEIFTHKMEGEQYSYEEMCGHYGGSVDGLINLPIYPGFNKKGFAVWEHKCVGYKTFQKLKKLLDGDLSDNEILKQWNEKYYGQIQGYIGATRFGQAFYTVALSGSRDYKELLIEEDRDQIAYNRSKAKLVITSDTVPAKLIDTHPEKASQECYLCKHKAVCQEGAKPLPTCRTCVHAAPYLAENCNAAWRCSHKRKMLDEKEQVIGCKEHMYIPATLSSFANHVGATEDGFTYDIKGGYRTLTNGPGDDNMSSHQIYYWNFDRQDSFTKTEAFEKWKQHANI